MCSSDLFSPDGNALAVEAGSGTVLLLDPDTGREYARLEDPNQDRASYLTFSQDGSQLLASAQDSTALHAWDLRAIRAELAKRDLDWDLPPYPPAAVSARRRTEGHAAAEGDRGLAGAGTRSRQTGAMGGSGTRLRTAGGRQPR